MGEDRVERKIRTRRLVMLFCILSLVVLGFGVLCLKSSYFNIRSINVENNNIASAEEIQILSEAQGKNIFLINKGKIVNNVKINPYIETAVIKRKFPSTLYIEVKEKEIKAIYQLKDIIINIDKEGRMVHAVNKFPSGKLPVIEGVTVEQFVPNEYLIKNDETKLKALKAALAVTNYNETKELFYSINVSDPYNIILKTKTNVDVKIGDGTSFEDKLSLALSALQDPSIKDVSGTLEIEPDGKAVFRKH